MFVDAAVMNLKVLLPVLIWAVAIPEAHSSCEQLASGGMIQHEDIEDWNNPCWTIQVDPEFINQIECFSIQLAEAGDELLFYDGTEASGVPLRVYRGVTPVSDVYIFSVTNQALVVYQPQTQGNNLMQISCAASDDSTPTPSSLVRSGTVAIPNIPGNYGGGSSNRYSMLLTADAGQAVHLTVTSFSTEPGVDILRIRLDNRSGATVFELSGDITAGTKLMVPGNVAYLFFSHDEQNDFPGFQLEFESGHFHLSRGRHFRLTHPSSRQPTHIRQSATTDVSSSLSCFTLCQSHTWCVAVNIVDASEDGADSSSRYTCQLLNHVAIGDVVADEDSQVFIAA